MDPEEGSAPAVAAHRQIRLQDVLKFASVPGFAITIYIAILGTVNFAASWSYLTAVLPPQLGVLSNEGFVLAAWAAGFVGFIYGMVVLFNRPYFTIFERINLEAKEGNFFGYLAGFVFLELVISLIASLSGVTPSLGVPNSFAPLVYGLSSLVFTALMQILVVYPLTLLFRELRKRYTNVTARQAVYSVLLVSIPVDGVIGYFTGLYSGVDIVFFLTIIVVNYICIRNGVLKAMVANLTMNLVSVASYLFLNIAAANILLAVYLYVWAFLGIFWVSGSLLSRAPQRTLPSNAPTERNVPQYGNMQREHISDLWIRSTCPSCGEAKFHVQNDLSLKCDKCGEVVQKDQIGPNNIIVQTRRAYR